MGQDEEAHIPMKEQDGQRAFRFSPPASLTIITTPRSFIILRRPSHVRLSGKYVKYPQ
jgi:hypothetical protein